MSVSCFRVLIYHSLSDFFFFFSSRRRHTRFDCDWSSDVCSSDLRLPAAPARPAPRDPQARARAALRRRAHFAAAGRSEEHTSELQSQSNLVCRLLLEKKKKPTDIRTIVASLV